MRIFRGVYLGLALFALLAHLLLGLGGSVAPLWLPVCLGMGVALALRQGTAAAVAPGPGAAVRPWVLVTTILIVVTVAVALGVAVTTTPAYDWDAVAAWSVKAKRLLQNPSLAQPFFEDPGVWHHSRDYPLLQPLCLASSQALLGEGLGRLWFVTLYVLMVGTAGFAVRNAGAGVDAACAAAVALGVTPILVDPTGGGFTSGYADAFLATAITAAAAGLVLRDAWLVASAVVLMIVIKPEGLVYGALVVAVPWLRDQRVLLVSAVGGFVLAAGLWLPIQLQLQQADHGGSGWVVWAGLLGIGVVLVLAQRWIRPSQRSAWLLTLVVVLAALVSLALLKLLVTGMGQADGCLTSYFRDPGRPLDRLPRLPHIVWGVVSYLFLPRKVGLLFAFLLAWVVLHKRLRPWTAPASAPAVGLLLALAAPCLLMPYLLSTEDNLAHHLRSSMGRLVLHWLGAGWVLGGLAIGQVLAPANARQASYPRRTAPDPC